MSKAILAIVSVLVLVLASPAASYTEEDVRHLQECSYDSDCHGRCGMDPDEFDPDNDDWDDWDGLWDGDGHHDWDDDGYNDCYCCHSDEDGHHCCANWYRDEDSWISDHVSEFVWICISAVAVFLLLLVGICCCCPCCWMAKRKETKRRRAAERAAAEAQASAANVAAAVAAANAASTTVTVDGKVLPPPPPGETHIVTVPVVNTETHYSGFRKL